MSFTNGFEKVAAVGGIAQFANKAISSLNPANISGAIGGLASRGSKAVKSGVVNFTQSQKAARTAAYHSARGTSPQAVQRLERMKARNPNFMETMKRDQPNWFKRHPVLTATGAFIGARALMGGGNSEPPPPPPQVVQY